jgi:YidC/Oxa1 family membrane protein insertase
MDKKNTTIGVVLLAAAIAFLMFGPRSPAPTRPANAQVATGAAATPGNVTASAPSAAAPDSTFAAINRDTANAQVVTLANDLMEVRLTNQGGAIRDVALKKFAEVEGQPDPYVFNHLHEDPILAFVDFPGLGRETKYEVVTANDREVVFRTVLDGKLEVTRRYTLTDPAKPGADPYRIRHETTFRNLTGATYPLPRPALALGTAALVNAQDYGIYLNVSAYDGSNSTYIERSDLQGGGLGSWFGSSNPPKAVVEKPTALKWASVKNQFFASIYTADNPGTALIARRIEFPPFGPDHPNIGLTGAARFELPALPANGSAQLAGMLYVGPKEYKRLEALGHDEEHVMQYDKSLYSRIFLGRWVAPAENYLLNASHRWIGDWKGSWGVAVIVMTLILKFVSLPFTLAASRSAKRMAKLQPQLKEIREKYKDNPQKQQMATMELFKTNKVNPVGGCIPILITFPLFIGFYAMLGGAAELRFQPFLWAPDLSAPDTIGHIAGFPINIMPLLMGITMIVQMQLTPTPSVDKAQAMMMKFMPVVFIAFCYNFSCALALYSTINGLFTIGQQLVINKMKDDPGPVGPGAAAATTAGAFARPVKNVTPKKKK